MIRRGRRVKGDREVARVRFVFGERQRDDEDEDHVAGLPGRSSSLTRLTAPSGASYRFRPTGKGDTSQWLPVRTREDADWFEGHDRFEVEWTLP
jgi:hypothetical protein